MATTEEILALYPELEAEYKTLLQSAVDPVQKQNALEIAMMQETDSLGRPRYTEDEIKRVSGTLLQTGFLSGYGTFEETAVNPIVGQVSYPQAIPAPQSTTFDMTKEALSPQAYILKGDEPGQTAYGGFQEEYTLDPELDAVLPAMLQEAYGLDDQQTGVYVQSFKSLYNKERERGKNQQQARNAVFDTLAGMADVPKLGKGKDEEDASILGALAMRTEDVGGVYPDYNEDQMLFLRNVKSGMVNNYVQQQLQFDKEEQQRSGRTTNTQIPYYRFKIGDASYDIPVEVYNYFEKNKQLSADVYTGSQRYLNDELREYFASAPSLGRILPKTEIMLSPNDPHQVAVYTVNAFEDIGGDEWYLDPVNKALVMSNPEAYQEIASSFPNILTPKTSILGGGTVETPVGYGMRVVTAPLTAAAVKPIESGLYPALDMMFGTDIQEETKRQRATYQPKYADYPVLGAIAADKGLVGYVGDALDVYGVQGADRRNIDLALIGTDMFLNPDVAAVTGAIKGVIGLGEVRNINKARKALGEATTATDYAKVLAMKPVQSVLDDMNGVSLAAKKIAPKKAENIKNWKVGDGRVLLETDVAKSLDARRIASTSDEPLQALYDNGLENTGYGKSLQKLVVDQNVDELTAVKNLDEVYTKNKGLDEYMEFNRILDDARATNFEDAISQAKTRGAVADLDYLEDIYKRHDNGVVFDALDAVQQKINRIFARKIVFENTPRVKGLDNIQFVSTKAAVHYDAYPKFLAKVKADPRAQALTSAITKDTRTGVEIAPPRVAESRYVSGDVGDARISLGKQDLVFYLDEAGVNNIQEMLQTLPLSSRSYDRIQGTLEQGKLFQGDYNLLLDNIKTSVATEMSAGMTTGDISRLGLKQQERLQEARGTSYRSGSPIADFVRNVKEDVGTMWERGSEYIDIKLRGKAPKRVLENMSEPTVAPVNAVGYAQKKLINNIKRQASTLDNRLDENLRELLTSKNMQELYGIEGEIDSISGLGYLVIGPRQVDDLGVLKQTQSLRDTLDWMYRQLIYADYKVEDMNYFDNNFGYKQIVIDNLYSTEGKKAYNEFLNAVAAEIMENKQDMWQVFAQRGEEWIQTIKKERIEVMSKKDPTQVLRTESYFKLNLNLDPGTIKDLSAIEIEAKVERLSMGSYFFSEMRRIHDDLLVEFIDNDLKPTDVGTLFKGGDVSQTEFDNLLKTSIHMLATETKITEDVMDTLREYADIELRYKQLRNTFGDDAVATLETDIKDQIKEFIGEQEFDTKFEKKYEQLEVTEQMGVEIQDTLDTLKVQYDMDIEALRNTKKAKFEREYAPIKEEYEKRIEKAKEEKTESEISKITREENAKAKAEKDPIEQKRVDDNKALSKKYREDVEKIKKQAQNEYRGLGGKGYNRAQFRAKQKEVKAKYKQILDNRNLEYEEQAKKINADAASKKEAIDEKYGEIKQKRKDEYAAIPEDQKTPSKVKQLRNELEAKRREINNKYEKERAKKARDLYDLRKEIEKAEREGLSEKSNAIRQEIRDKYDAQLEEIKNEYNAVRQQGLMAQINWLGQRVDLSDTKLEEAQRILETPSNDALVRDVAYKANEYATTILHNNNILNRSGFTAEDYAKLVDDMFRNDPDWGRYIFGEASFNEFQQNYSRYGIDVTNKAIRDWVAKEGGENGLKYAQHLFGTLQQLFYLGTLGLSFRSHGVNIATGSFITYTSTGQYMRSVDTVKHATRTTWFGSSAADPRAYQVAVTTPTGDVYTYRDIYDAIVKNGVRIQYDAIKQVLADGKVLRYIEANNKKYSGFSQRGMTKLRNMSATGMDKAASLLVKEDMIYRSGAMIEGLKQGMSFEEASQVARRSLFDYNDLTEFEKMISTYAFVFYNFSRQSFIDMTLGLQNPDILKRYLNMFKLHRDNQQLMRVLNDNKRFPHEVFFPQYTAVRNIMSYDKTDEDKTYDFFTMSPSLPAVESFALLVDMFQMYGNLRSDNPISRNVNKFTDPKLQYLFGQDSKYLAKRFPSEYINILKVIADDQEDLISWMQLIVGGEIKPRVAAPEDYATKAIGEDEYYIYDLDERQMKRLRAFNLAVGQLGIKRPATEYSKIFLSSEGTTWQAATPLQLAAATTGLVTPGRMKKPEIQQAEQLEKVLKEYQRRINASKKQTDQQLKP